MHKAAVLLACACLLLAACGPAHRTPPPPDVPSLTTPESLPDWARTGRLRSTRWDGGPIEAEKGRLSRWPSFTAGDPQSVLAATRDWYNPRTIDFLKTAHLNCALVTFSVGFSHQTERPQWDQLRRYIGECHRNGIRVVGYYSIANIFWRDMFQNIPLSQAWVDLLPDGSPRRYSASIPGRYMADIRNPEWLDYVKARVRAGVEAGIDGIWFDNTFSALGAGPVRRFLEAIHQEAASSGRKFVLMSNYNSSIYTWARFQNAAWTEDGREPGYYPDDPEDRRLSTNAGLLRYHAGISEGWRPVFVEYGGRHHGERFTDPLAPGKLQLAAAEAAAFQASFETLFEGQFARDCYFHEPQAIERLKAWGRYNAFLEQHEAHYLQPKSVARIAVLADTSDRLVPTLNQLAAHNLQFDVLFNYQEPPVEKLRPYRVILLDHTNPLSARLCSSLTEYVRGGGALVAVQDASFFGSGVGVGLRDALGISLRNLPQTRHENAFGKGQAIYEPEPLEPGALAAELQQLAGEDVVAVKAPATVLYNVVRQDQPRHLILHLLNYAQRRAPDVAVTVNREILGDELLSPDRPAPVSLRTRTEAGRTTFTVGGLETYDLIVITLK